MSSFWFADLGIGALLSMYIISPDFTLYSAEEIPETKFKPNWYILLFIVVVIPVNPVSIDKAGPMIELQLIVTPYPETGVDVKGIILNPDSLEANPVGW